MSKQISSQEIQEIQRLYVEERMGVRPISKIVHIGEATIINILKEIGVYRTKKVQEPEKEEIVRLFLEEGLNLIQIGKITRRSSSTIAKILKEKNINYNHSITPEEEESIVNLYKEGKSQRELASIFHRSTRIIKETLIKANVHKTIQETNISKYYIDENFFDVDNQTYNSAYVMGLIATDGCISRVDNQVYIELQRSDRELLEKVNLALKNEREVKDYITGRGYQNSKIYFYNRKIKQDLEKFHLIPNKTYDKNYKRPDLLEEKFELAFIRGMFDGDGCICMTKQNNRPTWRIDTSNEDIAKWIIEILEKYNIKLNHDLEPGVNLVMHRCLTSQKSYVKELYNLLYNNPLEENPIYMERKKKKFEEILSVI